MGKFFSHEYWAQNVSKIYKVLSKIIFIMVLIYGLIGAFALAALSFSSGIFPLFVVGVIIALLTPFLAGLASLTPLVTVTMLEKLTRNEENTRYLILEYCESRYKNGEITDDELKRRYEIINNR